MYPNTKWLQSQPLFTVLLLCATICVIKVAVYIQLWVYSIEPAFTMKAIGLLYVRKFLAERLPVMICISLILWIFEEIPNSFSRLCSSNSLRISPSTHSLAIVSLYWPKFIASKSFWIWCGQNGRITRNSLLLEEKSVTPSWMWT